MAFSVRLKSKRYISVSLPVMTPSPALSSVMPLFSASGARSVKTSSIIGAISMRSVQGTVRSSLISSRVLVICVIRSVCSRRSRRKSAVSGRRSGCSAENKSNCACISASGVRNSWAAFPVNCRWAVKPASSRSSIRLNGLLNCRNSGRTSSVIFMSGRLFGCTCSTWDAKVRRGLRA